MRHTTVGWATVWVSVAATIGVVVVLVGKIVCEEREERCRSLIRAIETGLRMYWAHNDGTYPPTDPLDPPGSRDLYERIRHTGHGPPHVEEDPSWVRAGQIINPVWDGDPDLIRGFVHYRNNVGLGPSVGPPPVTQHPRGPVNGEGFDLWATGCDRLEVSAVNNWE